MAPFKLRLLGGFELEGGNGGRLPTRKSKALLAYLALSAGRPHRRDKLATLLWGDKSDSRANHNLAQTLYLIRKTLASNSASPVNTDIQTVTLISSWAETDVAAFEQQVAVGTVEGFARAVELYRGDFLEGLYLQESTFAEWLQGEKARLRKMALDALERLLLHQTGENDYAAAIESASKILALEPFHDKIQNALMQLYCRSGRQVAAIQQYRSYAEILKRELDIEPDEDTSSLYDEILREHTLQIEQTYESAGNHVSGLSIRSRPERPSIAVIPFASNSDCTEQEYFADGISADIITALTKFRWLFVIARNSTHNYRDRRIDVQNVASELGVRYIVEGNVRRISDRIRVSVHLIDADTCIHIWAEKYDRAISDMFAVQDQITEAIVSAIAPEIGQAEIIRARRRPPDSLDAWTLYQRGMVYYPSGIEEDYQSAIALFDRAREEDSEFVEAIAMAAHIRIRYTYMYDSGRNCELLDEAATLLQAAMRLDQRNPLCYVALGRLHYTRREYDLAVEMASKAVALNPNFALAHLELGVALFGANRYEESLRHKNIALRLSPNDSNLSGMLSGRASALFVLGKYEECADAAFRSSRSQNPRYWTYGFAIASLTILGRMAEADAAKIELLKHKPDYSILEIEKFYLSAHPPDKVRIYCDALRKAGLPE